MKVKFLKIREFWTIYEFLTIYGLLTNYTMYCTECCPRPATIDNDECYANGRIWDTNKNSTTCFAGRYKISPWALLYKARRADSEENFFTWAFASARPLTKFSWTCALSFLNVRLWSASVENRPEIRGVVTISLQIHCVLTFHFIFLANPPVHFEGVGGREEGRVEGGVDVWTFKIKNLRLQFKQNAYRATREGGGGRIQNLSMSPSARSTKSRHNYKNKGDGCLPPIGPAAAPSNVRSTPDVTTPAMLTLHAHC